MRVTEIASALPDLKKTDKKLDKYLKSKSRSIGFFKPENYFNNTKSKFLNVKTDDLKLVVKQFKKTDKKIVRKFDDFLWKQNVFEKKRIAVGLYYYWDL